jgi:hypothetical protein
MDNGWVRNAGRTGDVSGRDITRDYKRREALQPYTITR